MNYLSCLEHIFDYISDNFTVNSRFYYIKNKRVYIEQNKN